MTDIPRNHSNRTESKGEKDAGIKVEIRSGESMNIPLKSEFTDVARAQVYNFFLTLKVLRRFEDREIRLSFSWL